MDQEKKSFFSSTMGIILVLLVILCFCCLILLFQLTRVPMENISTQTLETLENSIVSVNDAYDLACRLSKKCNIPTTQASGPFKKGDVQSFWLTNTDNAKSFQINATLQYVTNHAYFWVEKGVDYSSNDAKNLLNTFENKIYPTDREFFGSEWTPGVDNDPHIYLVYGRGIGTSVAGYFSSPDEYNSLAHKYSNAHEMFVFNADNSPLNDQYTYGVLAHEFQHMIHWKQDRNETSWMNEGFSEVAVLLNGYSVGGADLEFASNPDMQLTDWGPDPGTNGPHYGASFLFLTYFLDRFGENATKALVKDPQNGMDSVDDILKSIAAVDKQSNKPITANDVFMDWVTTNYVLNGSVGDGRYVYHNYQNAPKVFDTTTIANCPDSLNANVNQYGTDYVHFTCPGEHTLKFEGATLTGLLPVNPLSGKEAFWSNKGDESDMTLDHEFDLTKVTGPVTLKYHTWYDLEKDYDYIFLESSLDGGKTWDILKTPSGTDANPSGNSYGWGYNGKSNGWIEEDIDLSQFKGKKVQIRFEYVTDAAVNGEGMLLDDISIPEINYSTDFESDDGGWKGNGFVRVDNNLPQTFRLVMVNNNGPITVQNIDVNSDQTAEIKMDLSDATLIVSGTTRFTRELGNYAITVK